MSKYNNMLEANKQKNQEKVDRAILIIGKMLEEDEELTVANVTKRTGCSKSFLYQNELVKAEYDKARELQGDKVIKTKTKSIEKALELDNIALRKAVEEKNKRIAALEKENEKLKKQLENKITKALINL